MLSAQIHHPVLIPVLLRKLHCCIEQQHSQTIKSEKNVRYDLFGRDFTETNQNSSFEGLRYSKLINLEIIVLKVKIKLTISRVNSSEFLSFVRAVLP